MSAKKNAQGNSSSRKGGKSSNAPSEQNSRKKISLTELAKALGWTKEFVELFEWEDRMDVVHPLYGPIPTGLNYENYKKCFAFLGPVHFEYLKVDMAGGHRTKTDGATLHKFEHGLINGLLAPYREQARALLAKQAEPKVSSAVGGGNPVLEVPAGTAPEVITALYMAMAKENPGKTVSIKMV